MAGSCLRWVRSFLGEHCILTARGVVKDRDDPAWERSEPVHPYISSAEIAIKVRPPSGAPFSPEELATEEEGFRKLVSDSAHYHEAMKSEDGQAIMDNWQRVRLHNIALSKSRTQNELFS